MTSTASKLVEAIVTVVLAVVFFGTLIVLLLSSMPALAIDVSSCQTLSTDSSTYNLTGNLTANSGTCLTVSADNSTINLQGYTINYQVTAAGIAIDNNGTGNTITNGTIASGAYATQGTDANDPAISSGADVTITSVTFNLTSYSAERGLYGVEVGGSGDIEIGSCVFNAVGDGAGDSGIQAVRISSSSVVTGDIHNNDFNFTGTQILTGGGLRPVGVHVLSLTNSSIQRLVIQNNTFDFSSTIRDGHSVIAYAANGITINDNTMTNNGSDSRMILIDNSSDYWVIDTNTITESGPTTYDAKVAVRIRSSATTGTISNNTIVCSSTIETDKYGLSITADATTSFAVHNNTITDCYRGTYIQETASADYYNNTITVPDGGTAHWYLAWSNDLIDDITHGYEEYVCRNGANCRVYYLDEGGAPEGIISNITICTTSEVDGVAVADGDVESADTPGYTVTASGCLGSAPVGSGGGGGADGPTTMSGVALSGVAIN